MNIPKGFCQCGCGQRTNVTAEAGKGYAKGEPYRYVVGHNRTRWKGGRYVDGGYMQVWQGREVGYRPEHVLIAERALGKPLPAGAVVHHINGDKLDNRPQNLVVCQDTGYHHMLHRRQRALEATGNPDARKCSFCKQHDDPARMSARGGGKFYIHRECEAAYFRERRARQRAESQEAA